MSGQETAIYADEVWPRLTPTMLTAPLGRRKSCTGVTCVRVPQPGGGTIDLSLVRVESRGAVAKKTRIRCPGCRRPAFLVGFHPHRGWGCRGCMRWHYLSKEQKQQRRRALLRAVCQPKLQESVPHQVGYPASVSERGDKRLGDLLGTVLQKAGVVGVGVAATAFGGPEAGAAAALSADTGADALRTYVSQLQERREELYAKELLEDLEAHGEPEDPSAYAEAVFQNYRRAMTAIDDAVVPLLGRLTAMYRDRPRDPFFRACGRLLEDLSAEELEALRRLCSVFVSHPLEKQSDTTRTVTVHFPTERIQRTDVASDVVMSELDDEDFVQQWPQLARLLKRYGLADEAIVDDIVMYRVAATLDIFAMRKLHAVVGDP